MPRRIAVLAAILIAISGILAIGPGPRARADSPNGYCDTVKIIGVRGSGEAYNDGYAGFGPEMNALMADIWNGVAEQGVDVGAMAVPYPAYDFIAAETEGVDPGIALANLQDSISAGVDDLFQLVDSEAAICPNEKLVLIGYSQGATVVGDYLEEFNKDTAAVNSIVAVVMWADIKFNPTSRAAVLEPPGGIWNEGILSALVTGPRPEYPPEWEGRIASYCIRADPFCNFIGPFSLLNFQVHLDYLDPNVSSTEPDSASWATNMVMTNLPVNAPPGPMPPPPPAPTPPPPPPPVRDGLFVYNPGNGVSYVELPGAAGDWLGVPGPQFSAGWNIYPGNYSGSGLTDLFDYNPSTGASYVDFANGSGGWNGIQGPTFSTGWKIYPGNFSGNGLTDLFDYNPSTGASYVDLANGSGGWAGVAGPRFSAGWNVYTGKFTSSGLTDLFVYNPSTGASYVELANGAGGWTGVKGPTFSAGWQMYPGNFTGNGLTDLFDYNPSTGASYVDLANGSGGWTGIAGPRFSAGWNVYTGKLTSSGLSDLFVYNPGNGASYVELANGAGGWTGVKGPTFSTGWQMYTGDFTGNGLTDLFDYNPSTGASYVDLANGSGGWTGIAGPRFSTGWNVYTGVFDHS